MSSNQHLFGECQRTERRVLIVNHDREHVTVSCFDSGLAVDLRVELLPDEAIAMGRDLIERGSALAASRNGLNGHSDERVPTGRVL